jgi:hypothetical protein
MTKGKIPEKYLTGNGKLSIKAVVQRIDKALKPFGSKFIYKWQADSILRNSVYVTIDCKGRGYNVRISNHHKKTPYDGLDIVLDNTAGIVKPLREYANFIIKDSKIDGETYNIIKRTYNGQTLNWLKKSQLLALREEIDDLLAKRKGEGEKA